MRCAAQRKGRFAVDFFSWQRFADAWPKILPYFSVTLQIVVTAETAGILLGLLIALARMERVPALQQIFAVYVSFYAGHTNASAAVGGLLWAAVHCAAFNRV